MAQKKTLNVSIENKIATYQKRCGAIVCGNSDYQIKFAFDAEWYSYDTKTARFIYNDQIVDKLFTGDTCDAPVVRDADILAVGVFAGDLVTTTPAIIPCKRSIRCKHGAPAEPSPDVYDQIMERLNGMPSTGGGSGSNGATFTPAVSSAGVISWTNDKGLKNPAPVNIRGPQGQTGGQGPAGADGKDGRDGFSPTVSIEELSNGVRVTITDKNGPKSFVIYNGNGGDPGGSGGSGGGDNGGDSGGGEDIVDGHYYVSTFATNALTSNTATKVQGGSSYSTTLSTYGDDIVSLPEVTVEMGGVDITGSCFNRISDATASINIPSVTGDVKIIVGNDGMLGEDGEVTDSDYTVKLVLNNAYTSDGRATIPVPSSDAFLYLEIKPIDDTKTVEVLINGQISNNVEVSEDLDIGGYKAIVDIQSVTKDMVITATAIAVTW